MKSFKVGDSVRRINRPFGKFKVGDTGIIKSIFVIESSNVGVIKFFNDNTSYIVNNFEFVPIDTKAARACLPPALQSAFDKWAVP